MKQLPKRSPVRGCIIPGFVPDDQCTAEKCFFWTKLDDFQGCKFHIIEMALDDFKEDLQEKVKERLPEIKAVLGGLRSLFGK